MKYKSEWMHPRRFVSNNIEYRIASANALASFKRDQSFIMGQVAYNPHHKFSTLAKEIMLLKYDVWYDYLNDVEQYLLCNSDKDLSELIDYILNMSNARIVYYKNTLAGNFTDESEKEYLQQWHEYHEYIYSTLIKEVSSLKSSDITCAQLFTKTVRMITKSMNHTLYELQELDILRFSNDSPSFNVDDICITILRDDRDAFLNRVYRFLEVRDFKNIVIKQQTDVSLTNMCKYSMDILKDQGISSVIV